MKIYIVKGEHPTVPGSPELVTLDKSAADAFAAELVSVLARDIADRDGDEEDVDQPAPEDWQSHLRWCQARQYMHFRKDRFPVSYEEARKAIEEMSDNERVVETECDVRIEEHDIEAPAPDVAVIVEGGIVQHVTARGGPVRVIVVDYDVDEEHLPDGVVMVPQDQSDPAPADITVHSVDHDSAPEFWQAVAGDQPASCQNPNLAAAMHAADECAAAAAPFNAAAQSAKRAQEAAADIISGGEPEAASASIDGDELHCVVHTDAFLLAPHIELRAGDMLGIDPETGEVRKALPGDKVAGRFDPRTMTVDPDGYLTVANPGLFDPKPSPRLIETDVQKARLAVDHIRKARDLLKDIGAQRALDKTRRALNSAEGALRHAENKETRQGKGADPMAYKAPDGTPIRGVAQHDSGVWNVHWTEGPGDDPAVFDYTSDGPSTDWETTELDGQPVFVDIAGETWLAAHLIPANADRLLGAARAARQEMASRRLAEINDKMAEQVAVLMQYDAENLGHIDLDELRSAGADARRAADLYREMFAALKAAGGAGA